MKSNCQFCDFGGNSRSRHFSNVMRETIFEEIIHSEKRMILIPDVAPCSIGHMLIVSRNHVRSMREEWNSPEVYDLIRNVESCLPAGIGLVVFEHGIISDKAKPSCVEHAHAHLIPFSESVVPGLENELGKLVPIGSPKRLSPPDGAPEYAIVRDIDQRWYKALQPVIPGQAIRRATMGADSRIHWNWLDYIEFCEPLDTRNRILKGSNIFEMVRAHYLKA